MGVFDPDRHENIQGLTDLNEIYAQEALGIIRAEEFIIDLETDVVFDVSLILKIHRIAFHHLYEWAGKWRNQRTNIGIEKEKIPYSITEYAEQVEYFKNHIHSNEELINCISYAHHRFTFIHPFNNGNGRTARLITDLLSMLNGYQPINLYVKEDGSDREKYKAALKAADKYDDTYLKELIRNQLRQLT